MTNLQNFLEQIGLSPATQVVIRGPGGMQTEFQADFSIEGLGEGNGPVRIVLTAQTPDAKADFNLGAQAGGTDMAELAKAGELTNLTNVPDGDPTGNLGTSNIAGSGDGEVPAQEQEDQTMAPLDEDIPELDTSDADSGTEQPEEEEAAEEAEHITGQDVPGQGAPDSDGDNIPDTEDDDNFSDLDDVPVDNDKNA